MSSQRKLGTSKRVYSPENWPLIQQRCAYQYQDKAEDDEQKSTEPFEQLRKGDALSRQDSSTINGITSSQEVLSAPEVQKLRDNRFRSEWKLCGQNDKQEGDQKLAESNYEYYKSEQYDPHEEKRFIPSDVNVRNLNESIIRAALFLFDKAGVESSQSISLVQHYLNHVQKSEHNRQLEEAHCSQVQQFGSINGYCLNTASFSSTLFKSGLSVKFCTDQEEKKRMLLPLSISKHKMILSSSLLEKCSFSMLMLLKLDLTLDHEEARFEPIHPQGNDSRDSPLVCDGSSPLPLSPFSSTASGTVQAHKRHRVSRVSSKTKEFRLNQRRIAEKRREEYCNSSSSSEEYD